jgi:hypothetical protein
MNLTVNKLLFIINNVQSTEIQNSHTLNTEIACNSHCTERFLSDPEQCRLSKAGGLTGCSLNTNPKNAICENEKKRH